MKAARTLLIAASGMALATAAQAAEVAPGPVLALPGSTDSGARPIYDRNLPADTPSDQVERAAGQPVTGFVEALERAYWTNPELLAERARLRSVDFRLPAARAGYGPTLQYSASYGWQRDGFEQSAGGYRHLSGWTSTATAVLTQPLLSFGRTGAAEDQARAEIDLQRETLRFRESQVLFGAIASYTSVVRDRAGMTIARENLDVLERELTDTRARQSAREATITDLNQVETQVSLGRATLYSAMRSATSSEADFLRSVGAPPGLLERPRPLELPVRTLEEAYTYAERHNPVIAAAYARERASRAASEAARAATRPRVDLTGRASLGTVTPYSDSLRQTELRGAVTLSGTLTSGALRARIDEADAANDADWRLIDLALRENRSELADAWAQFETQTASIVELEASADAAQRALDGAIEQERAGMRTTLDVLQLTRDLLQVRTTLNATRASAFVSSARILAALGALEQADLLPDSPRYDPEVHFADAANDGDIPVLTPVISLFDSVFGGKTADRPIRDPAGPVALDDPGYPRK